LAAKRYAPRSDAIIAEEIDGEVIIVDLDSGSYFSVTGVGVAIWNAIAAGASDVEVLERLARAFPREAALEADLAGFLDRVVEADLLEWAPAGRAHGAAPLGEAPLPAVYVAPVLATFDDMKDLLLVDPIHDVDESGWPARKSEPGQAA